MTLRVTLEIVPFGDESQKYTIETVNISNVTYLGRNNLPQYDTYVVEHNQYKSFNKNTPTVHHIREQGAITLAIKALRALK